MTLLRLSRVLHGTLAEGPHLRSAVWVQGCSIRCKGCINPQLFSTTGGTPTSPQDIVNDAIAAGVEGLTLLGGEPFDQAEAGADLAEAAQAAGLGIITFSGFNFEELQNASSQHRRLIDATDLLVDGPYDQSSPEQSRALVGSSNQRFIHLSERYSTYDPQRASNRVDVRIDIDGTINVAGFLTTERLSALTADVAIRRRRVGSQ